MFHFRKDVIKRLALNSPTISFLLIEVVDAQPFKCHLLTYGFKQPFACFGLIEGGAAFEVPQNAQPGLIRTFAVILNNASVARHEVRGGNRSLNERAL